MPFRKFTDIDEFNNWHKTIMSELGIPDGLGTVTYSKPIIHPIDNSIMAIVDERGYNEKEKVFTSEDLYDLGYLKKPNITLL